MNCKRSNNRYKQKRPQLSVFDSGLLSVVSVWSMYLRTSIMQFLSNNQKYSKNTIELPKSYFQILFFSIETLIFLSTVILHSTCSSYICTLNIT